MIFFIYDAMKKKNPQEKLFTEKLLIIQSRCKITPLPQNCLFWLVKLRLFYESWQKEENWRFQIHSWHKFWQPSNNNILKDWHFIHEMLGWWAIIMKDSLTCYNKYQIIFLIEWFSWTGSIIWFACLQEIGFWIILLGICDWLQHGFSSNAGSKSGSLRSL